MKKIKLKSTEFLAKAEFDHMAFAIVNFNTNDLEFFEISKHNNAILFEEKKSKNFLTLQV